MYSKNISFKLLERKIKAQKFVIKSFAKFTFLPFTTYRSSLPGGDGPTTALKLVLVLKNEAGYIQSFSYF